LPYRKIAGSAGNLMEIKAYAIADIESMKRVENLWNASISEHNGSPFLLSGFVNQLVRQNYENLLPYYLAFFRGNKIVGVVPAAIRDTIVRYGCFLPGRDFQPDLVFDSRYRSECSRKTIEILFGRLRCQFVDFSLPFKSPNLHAMKQACTEFGINFSDALETGRAILPVKGSWMQFEKSRRKVRREFERTERRMREMGRLDIMWLGKEDNENEVFRNIQKVESASWKKPHLLYAGFKEDPTLSFIFNGCLQTSLADSSFDWGVGLLELEGKTIAYCLFLTHNGHAYVCKTSFDNRYRKYSPGIYVNHAVVRELMNRANVKVIDFMTDLPFSHKWASEVVPVVRFRMSRRSVAPLLLRRILAAGVVKWAMNSLEETPRLTRRVCGTLLT